MLSKSKTLSKKRHLHDVFVNSRGAVDLASIMVGIVVLGILGGVAYASIFAVVPWMQNNTAKNLLSSVQQAEGVYSSGLGAPQSLGNGNGSSNLAFADPIVNLFNSNTPTTNLASTSTSRSYGSLAALVSGKYLQVSNTSQIRVSLGVGSTCYVASVASSSGQVFWSDSLGNDTQLYTTTSKSTCVDLSSAIASTPAAAGTTPSATATATATQTPTTTPSSPPTQTSTPSSTPTATATPTQTSTPSSTPTATATPTQTPTQTPTTPPAPQYATVLANGQQLASPNGQYILKMQSDGNLVEYGNGTSTHALWYTSTAGSAANGILRLNSTGNLEVASADGTTVYWTSGTGNNGNLNNVLSLNNDGALQLSNGSSYVWNNGTISWDTATPGMVFYSGMYLHTTDGTYKAIFQADGNFVVYQNGTAIWNSGTGGKANGGYAAFQSDGNFVIYNSSNGVAYNAATSGKSATRMTMQTDGNLVIYAGSTALWHTK